MIRPARGDDLPALKRIAEGSGMFLGEELRSFVDVMTGHIAAAAEPSPSPATLVVATSEAGDRDLVGGAYFAPEAMAQGVMNLLFISVLPEARSRGVGKALLAQFEGAALRSRARLAIIETASDPMFAPAWALYRRAGYEQEATVRDFYDAGLDKLIFRKPLS